MSGNHVRDVLQKYPQNNGEGHRCENLLNPRETPNADKDAARDVENRKDADRGIPGRPAASASRHRHPAGSEQRKKPERDRRRALASRYLGMRISRWWWCVFHSSGDVERRGRLRSFSWSEPPATVERSELDCPQDTPKGKRSAVEPPRPVVREPWLAGVVLDRSRGPDSAISVSRVSFYLAANSFTRFERVSNCARKAAMASAPVTSYGDSPNVIVSGPIPTKNPFGVSIVVSRKNSTSA